TKFTPASSFFARKRRNQLAFSLIPLRVNIPMALPTRAGSWATTSLPMYEARAAAANFQLLTLNQLLGVPRSLLEFTSRASAIFPVKLPPRIFFVAMAMKENPTPISIGALPALALPTRKLSWSLGPGWESLDLAKCFHAGKISWNWIRP